MTIEICDIQYWKPLTYYDSLLYCQLLNVDGYNNWRLFTSDEYINHKIIIKEYITKNPDKLHPQHIDMTCYDGLRLWPQIQENDLYDAIFMTIPVRTV
jgi:hypothetical protein